MAMNRDLIGRSYTPATFEVEQEAMIRYALATNETNPRLLDESSEGGLIAPPLVRLSCHVVSGCLPTAGNALYC